MNNHHGQNYQDWAIHLQLRQQVQHEKEHHHEGLQPQQQYSAAAEDDEEGSGEQELSLLSSLQPEASHSSWNSSSHRVWSLLETVSTHLSRAELLQILHIVERTDEALGE